MMDDKLKQKWIKALRSGKYRQAEEALRGSVACYYDDNDFLIAKDTGEQLESDIDLPTGHCCLGVLCEIMPGIEWNDDESRYEVVGENLKALFGDPPPQYGDFKDNDEWLVAHNKWVKQNGGSINWDKKGDHILITGEDLPWVLQKHFGFTKRVLMNKRYDSLQSKLIDMNDNGTPFTKIANYLERVKF